VKRDGRKTNYKQQYAPTEQRISVIGKTRHLRQAVIPPEFVLIQAYVEAGHSRGCGMNLPGYRYAGCGNSRHAGSSRSSRLVRESGFNRVWSSHPSGITGG